ncbi:GHMP family kinase ATP-binding protein [Streptomyces sp. CB00455]|uniref:GHMP family kinase ATP-binding protein n=1 Tax=Streptomyces sp. CB00455 TaxID=1703927 RepID=UPI001F5B6E04|nr:kinase [Streptomyces sp. CB00455]
MARVPVPTTWPATATEEPGPWAVGSGWALGTFGELLQGVLPDDRHFLVTLPITIGSTATFRYADDAAGITVEAVRKRKSARVVALALEALGRPGGGELLLASELPEGKGLASSSADLVASVRAVADAFGTSFPTNAVEAMLREVEPSDGVMHDEIVAFLHREVRLHSRLGHLPRLVIVGYDEGGQVDTVTYNRRPAPVDAETRAEYAALLDRLAGAVADGDLRTVGAVATRSAELHARTRPRAALAPLVTACDEADGLGVVVAHSGTVLGVLFAADDPELDRKTSHIQARCARLGGPSTIYHYAPGLAARRDAIEGNGDVL